ncbi:MAG: hypothetical protein IPO08_21675 [Xanthomonadales bacterium]|nr:hypothetical protein [Xanthomonadales bacterium]
MSHPQRKPNAFNGELTVIACPRKASVPTKHVAPKSAGSWWTQAEGGEAFAEIARTEQARMANVSSAPMPDLPTAREARA